ncbi:MAG: HPP family protein [Cytophagales bacterium]|nr:HPP family protein [Cytophagales bacterium]
MKTFLDKLRGDKMPIAPRARGRAIALTWLGCWLAVGLLAWLSVHWQAALLMAPFGASCLLVFGYPDGFFSQPRHVVVGHVLSSLIGLLLLRLFGPAWWSLALAVATAVAAMMWLRVVHPPAGANAIIIFMTQPSWEFLLYPSLVGALLIVGVALIYHNITRPQRYPKYW